MITIYFFPLRADRISWRLGKVRDVTGSVTVDDGSGSINVSDVEADLIIENDGSGSLNFSNIGGHVETDG